MSNGCYAGVLGWSVLWLVGMAVGGAPAASLAENAPAGPTWSNLPPAGAESSDDPTGFDIRFQSNHDFVGIAGPGSRVLVVGQQVWDLVTGKVTATIPLTADDGSMYTMSRSGKLLVVGKSRHHAHEKNTADAVIWNTQTGLKVSEVAAAERDVNADFMGVAGEQWLLISGRPHDERPAVMEVWNALTGKLDHRFVCDFAGAQMTSISPDGRYVAVGNDEKIQIYDIGTGAVVSTILPPSDGQLARQAVHVDMDSNHVEVRHVTIPFNGLAALAFSPDGGQLAAVVNNAPFAEEFRLLCWDNNGKVLDNFTFRLHREFTLGEGPLLAWSPDKKAFLIRQHWLVDRGTQRLAWCCQLKFADYARLTFYDPKRLLIIHSDSEDQATELLPIPWIKIRAALAGLQAGTPDAAMRPGKSVSVEISCSHLRGDEGIARQAMLGAITRRLGQDGIGISEGQPTVVALKLTEGWGNKEKVFVFKGPFDFGGTDTGRTVWDARGIVDVTVKNRSTGEVYYHTALHAQGYPQNRRVITDATQRADMLSDLQREMLLLSLPYYVAGDGTQMMLPLGLPQERRMQDFLHDEPPPAPPEEIDKPTDPIQRG